LDGRQVETDSTRSHRRWRRRNLRSSQRLWRHRAVDHEFFLRGKPTRSPVIPAIPEKTVSEFCEKGDFLAPMRLFRGLKEEDHRSMTQQTYDSYCKA